MDNSETQEVFNSIKDKLSHWTSSVFNEFYGLQKLGSLYYYTDMNALVNGIIVPEPEVNREICLWATKWSHLNDSQENYIALDMLKDVFKNNLEVYNAFVSLSGDNHSISFSKEKDYLPMWSMYGAQGTGIMLEFDVSELLKIYGVLVPYIKEYLPKSCLKSVWLGPTADKELSLDALRSYLESRNIEAEVNCSQIPYRG